MPKAHQGSGGGPGRRPVGPPVFVPWGSGPGRWEGVRLYAQTPTHPPWEGLRLGIGRCAAYHLPSHAPGAI